MEERILAEIERMINDYFPVSDLNKLLKRFVRDKSEEGPSLWSELTLCCGGMLGGDLDRLFSAAAHVELLMLALDIVDDVQDQDNPDKPWMQCQPAYALQAILAFITASVSEIAGSRPAQLPRLLRFIAQAISGQQRDLNHSVQTEADYIVMIQEKSASLMNVAVAMGYLQAAEPPAPETVARLDELAQYVGIVAQLKNDTRDLLRPDLKNDLLHKKKTLPVLFLLQHSREQFPALILFYEGRMDISSFVQKKAECLQYIRDSGCLEYARAIQFLFANKAQQLLQSLEGTSPWKERLIERVMSVLEV
ncbi:polyprenyl synthetase family protein [Paenibacillus athensensis]|uniref:Polyprenyl synthetase n=1 Tax=Paenibacillus athensensis TaxID=1967502 RepID=A0A4Y8PV23_9BACL|nr:class 1 isoprenoid biosynthesis enzyme [Paenibacillus athensensis]MCD1258171.1 polyprenyl synthetase family protein [Paenibacillus athensensis]